MCTRIITPMFRSLLVLHHPNLLNLSTRGSKPCLILYLLGLACPQAANLSPPTHSCPLPPTLLAQYILILNFYLLTIRYMFDIISMRDILKSVKLCL